MTWGLVTHDCPSHATTQAAWVIDFNALLDAIIAAGAAATPASVWTRSGSYTYPGASAVLCAWGKITHTSGAELATAGQAPVGTNCWAHLDNMYKGVFASDYPLYSWAWKPAEGGGTFPIGNNPWALTTFCRDAGSTGFCTASPVDPHLLNRRIHIMVEGAKVILIYEHTIGTPYTIAIFAGESTDGLIDTFFNVGDVRGQGALVWSSTFSPGSNQPRGTMWSSRVGAETLSTVGSSTTVTTTNNDFATVAIGDTLVANGLSRLVSALSDDNNVIVNTAVDWSGVYTYTHGVRMEAVQLEGRNTYLQNTVNPTSPWIYENLVAWANQSGGIKGFVKSELLLRSSTSITVKQQLDSGNSMHVANGAILPWEPTFGPL